jgi:uncharacterized protein (DUF2235 family)
MKHIVICCDGTWNDPDERAGGLVAPTNVARIAGAVAWRGGDVRQLMYYDPGIGTSSDPAARLLEGYTGHGVSANIRRAYRFLVQYYQPGDRLFLFGFSRGAFTVRSLAGLIRTCGILRRDAISETDRAFALYRDRSRAMHPRAHAAILFKRTYAIEPVTPILFIGVWDTVGALGNPLLLGRISPHNRFHDTTLSSTVRCACQALAIDEHRRLFAPTLWHRQPEATDQLLEQMWFAGSHSNVGGGYADAGLADIALLWMAERARAQGLVLDALDCHPNPRCTLQDSRTGLFAVLPGRLRTTGGAPDTGELVHPSVLMRCALDSGYRPANLLAWLVRSEADLRPHAPTLARAG